VSWARFDDRYDDNRKVKRAWRRHPRAVGLHAMAITYSTRHQTDGIVDLEWVEEKLPSKVDREKVLVVLLGAGLLERLDDEHFVVHDFLDYNESREEREAARIEERERKRAAGRKGGLAKAANARRKAESGPESASSDLAPASGLPEESLSGPSSASVARTAPHRTAPTKPPSPHGGNGVEAKDLDDAKQRLKREAADRLNAEFDEWLTDHAAVTGHTPPRAGTKARAAVASSFAARRQEDYSLDDLKLATRGARHDDYRREHGYDTAESILRPTKIHDLIGKGRRAKTPAGGIDDIVERAERREQLLEQQRREREASGARS
jgi:hypothetical protein